MCDHASAPFAVRKAHANDVEAIQTGLSGKIEPGRFLTGFKRISNFFLRIT